MSDTLATFHLEIAGIGLVIYSPFAMAGVAPDTHFLEEQFWDPAAVARHVCAGSLAAFCTGGNGIYDVEFVAGGLTAMRSVRCRWWIRLALEVRDRTVCIRDLYDFARWKPTCPPAQTFELADGFYRLSVGTAPTDSGLVGDDQLIVVCCEPVDALPQLEWEGVPFLGPDDDDDDDDE